MKSREEINDYVWNNVKDKVSNIINDCLETIELLDLSNVPEEELKDAADPLKYCFADGSFGNPLKYDCLLNEALKRIYSPEEVVKYINDKYNLYNWQTKLKVSIQNRNRDVKFIAILPFDENIVNMVKNDMDKLGYFLGNTVDAAIIGYPGLTGYVFHPVNQKNVAETIRQYQFLYHVTPATNLNNILKRGILRKSSTRLRASYPERVYLVEGRHNYDTLHVVAEMIYDKRRNSDKNADSKYAIIALDMDEIPKDIPMYYDGDYEYGVFVEENIPAKAINEIRIYDCETRRYVKYGFWEKIKNKILSLFR